MRPGMSFIIAGRKAFSRTNRKWWIALTEALFAGAIVVTGVALLVIFLTLAVLNSTPDQLYTSVGFFLVQLLVAVGLIVVGTYCVAKIFWKVAASEERRSAIVSRAGEIELFNELRKGRENLPTVPSDRYRPTRGIHQPYRLVPSRRNVWGLGSAAVLSLLFVSIAVILVVISVTAWQRDTMDWLATALTVPICGAALWSMYNAFRRLLALTGVGPPALEVSEFPFVPGEKYQFHLSQPGRVRLQLLNVRLICQEEATFNEGTDVRTERQTVFEQRLLRRRGLDVRPDKPYTDEFELILPACTMHSFKSASNRVTWKIEVEAAPRGWPTQKRSFTISVLPE